MFGIHDFGLFISSAIVLTLTPGQDTFYILGRSISQGRGAGIASVLGISTGALIHTAVTAFGLSAVLAASPNAFLIIKILGALYLIYLGLRMLFSPAVALAIEDAYVPIPFSEIFRQGLITNLLNPKVALFFLAFIPQFVSPQSPRKSAALLTLSLTFLAIGTTWCLCLALFSSLLGEKLRRHDRFPTLLNRGAGSLFILLGLRLAFAR